jgi:glycosyltransferase involved in cell wall biosynthesis
MGEYRAAHAIIIRLGASMKILLVSGLFPPDIGGPATYTATIAAALSQRGDQVRVLAYGPSSGRFYDGEVSIWRLSRRILFPARFPLFALLCFIRALRVDVVFAQDIFSAGFPAALACIFSRRPLAVKIVGDFAWEYARGMHYTELGIDAFQAATVRSPLIVFLRYIQRFICARSARIIVPSAYLKNLVMGWGVSAQKIIIIRNAVPAPDEVYETRDPQLFFAAGRMVPWKRFDAIVRAFARVAHAHPLARLAIAGDGPCMPFIQHATPLFLRDRIMILGTLSNHEMHIWYARAGCFILFSDYEGMSHVLLEALAHRVPVIASDAGGNGEIIAHGVNSLLVPQGDENALCLAIDQFLRDPDSIPAPGISISLATSPAQQVTDALQALCLCYV